MIQRTEINRKICLVQGRLLLVLFLILNVGQNLFAQVRVDTLNTDGAWCWFNDPRAVYYKGVREQTFISWVNTSGDIMIGAYNHETGIYIEHCLYPRLQVDDHDNPAIFIRRDGRLVVFFSKHTTGPAHRFVSKDPEDITSWGEDYTFGENVTYPYPFQVGDSIFVFYRGINWHPTLIVSGDDGETMGSPQQIISGGGARPYARYCQDKTGAIHLAFTTAHPRDDPNNKIYYACYKNGKFYKADGTYIKDFTGSGTALDIDLNEAETVYPATQGKGWIWDIAVDENNQPVLVFASFPSDTDHRYHYARWTGSGWDLTELTRAGKWFPQTPAGASEREPNYSGGISLDDADPSTVYLSRQVGGVFEIFRFSTPDQGLTWDSTALTSNTPADIVNVRPVVPRHHAKGIFDLIWMRGKYVHYTDYHTSLVFWSDTTITAVDSLFFSLDTLELARGQGKSISVSFVPFISSSRTLEWTSSDEEIAEVHNGQVIGLSPGTATIAARAFNGKSASCVVRVIPPEYVSDALFDFGTSTSPVATGARQVTETTEFQNSYGWTSPVSGRDRGSAWDAELRDFNFSSSPAVFNVLVRNGTYHITVSQGDLDYSHDAMNLYVNGDLKSSSVSSAAGSYTVSEFEVEATGEILEFKFEDSGGSDANWVINSLKLEASSGPTPELFLQEDSIPGMTAGIGESDIELINLSGSELTAEIILSISGPDAGQFLVIPESILKPESGILPATVVSIVYRPLGAGNHTGILTIHSDGAEDLSLTISGSTLGTGIHPLAGRVSVYSEPGRLVVRGIRNFLVYNVQGLLLAEIQDYADLSSVDLDPGIYLVKVGNSLEKVVVQ